VVNNARVRTGSVCTMMHDTRLRVPPSSHFPFFGPWSRYYAFSPWSLHSSAGSDEGAGGAHLMEAQAATLAMLAQGHLLARAGAGCLRCKAATADAQYLAACTLLSVPSVLYPAICAFCFSCLWLTPACMRSKVRVRVPSDRDKDICSEWPIWSIHLPPPPHLPNAPSLLLVSTIRRC
jgi:hypothetical protein